MVKSYEVCNLSLYEASVLIAKALKALDGVETIIDSETRQELIAWFETSTDLEYTVENIDQYLKDCAEIEMKLEEEREKAIKKVFDQSMGDPLKQIDSFLNFNN